MQTEESKPQNKKKRRENAGTKLIINRFEKFVDNRLAVNWTEDRAQYNWPAWHNCDQLNSSAL
jgi:hypothetical protein